MFLPELRGRMNPAAITEFITSKFTGVKVVVASSANGAPEAAWGDIFFIYDPDDNLPPQRQFPFATIVVKDYPGFDEASNLNRPGIFRLNLGLNKDTFRAALRSTPENQGTVDESEVIHDFAAINKLMPHPVYRHAVMDLHSQSIANPRFTNRSRR